MSELSWRLQRLYLLPPVTPDVPPTESPLDSPVSAPETELLPPVPAAPEHLELAVAAPASAPSGLLSEGQTAVILQGYTQGGVALAHGWERTEQQGKKLNKYLLHISSQ